MPNELQKAHFCVELPNNKLETLPVQFNPTEMTFAKGVQLAEVGIPGIDSPIQQFVRGQAEKLTLDLFFDTTESGMDAQATSVTTLTDAFYRLVKINSQTHAPPICQFAWNKAFPGANLPADYAQQQRLMFRCIVENVSQKFTLFTPQGIPLRATLTVTLREYKSLEEQLKELNLQSPDHTKAYVVQRGDTLSAIAGDLYGSPAQWRTLATSNGITDPRRLTPGRVLEAPPIS